MCPQSPIWRWSTVRCSMFEHIEGRNWTCRHRCELREGCIGGCGWSWFLVVSLQCTVVSCRQFDDGLHHRISSSCWQSASLVEFSSQGYASSWWRWSICCSQRGQTSQPCVVQTSAGLYGLPGMGPRPPCVLKDRPNQSGKGFLLRLTRAPRDVSVEEV